MRSVSSRTGAAYSRDTELVTHRQPSRAGWWRLLLAALAAAVVTLLGAGTASAVTVPVPETRVGASTPTVARVVGPHECITAGQRWGNAPPQADSVVATGVAAKADIPLPVRPPGHTVDVSVHGPDGRVLDSYSLHSGSMSPGEQALGFPQGPLASHTENRVARVSGASSSPAVSGDPFAGLRPVSSGDYVVIQGTKPPCPSCQGALNRAQVETGATFVYVWNGGRSWWQAGRPLG